MSSIEKKPLVSIVVTTRNEEKHIENCLLSIKEQSYPHIETIVVDNDSTDRTKKIARKYTALVFNKGPERSAQRNHGMISIATGEYVMYVDADMILSPNLIETCVIHMKRHECLALHIPEIILGTSYWSKVRRFERSFYNGTVIDGARFFKRSIFIAVDGFDESLNGPEDWDIDKKIKKHGLIGLLEKKSKRSIYDWELSRFIRERGVTHSPNDAVVYHNESEFNIKTYLSKKTYYTPGFLKYIEKWGENDPEVRKQFGFSYRYFIVFTEQYKILNLLKNMHLSLGLYFLRASVGIAFAKAKFLKFQTELKKKIYGLRIDNEN